MYVSSKIVIFAELLTSISRQEDQECSFCASNEEEEVPSRDFDAWP